jgi:hypothetical protein
MLVGKIVYIIVFSGQTLYYNLKLNVGMVSTKPMETMSCMIYQL